MNEEARRPNLTLAIFGACGMVLAGFAFFIWQTSSTPSFRALGGGLAVMLTVCAAVVLVPTAIVASLVITWLQSRGHWPRWLERKTILIAGATILLLAIGTGLYGSDPEDGLFSEVPAAKGVVSDVRVEGFTSFLSSRWLYSFQVKPADAERIALALGLQEDPRVNLRTSLEKDVAFSAHPLPCDMAVPEGTKGYYRVFKDGPEDQSVGWTTMAVSEQDGRAWIYRGYQN
jgi:hypothetical protein